MALADLISQLPGGRGAFLVQRQMNDQRDQVQAQQGLAQLLGMHRMIQEQEAAKQSAELQPLRRQLLEAQAQEHALRAAKGQREAAFYSPGNMQQFMTPGQEAQAPGQGQVGGMDEGALGQIMAPQQGVAPRLDLGRMVDAAASQGLVAPETLLNQRALQQERQVARQQRMEELQLRLADARTTAQDKMTLQRELAQMQIDSRRDMANMAASLRQPRQDPLVQVEIDDPARPGQKTLRYVPQSQAAGMTPPTKATSDKPLTEFQGKAVLYGTRTAQSDKVLRDLEDKVSTVGLSVKQAAQSVPLIGGMMGAAGNVMLSDSQQRVEQAQRDFVNAVLRQESGAVISDAEFANAKKQYFPQPGDSPAVVTQKRRNREIAINGFKRMSGPGSADIDAIQKEPLMPTTPARDSDIDALVRKYSG